DADHLRQRHTSVRERLQDMPADRDVELRVGKGEPHRIVPLETSAIADVAGPQARTLEVRLLQVDAEVGHVGKEPQEGRRQFSRSAADVEDARTSGWTMPRENRLLLRPDRFDLR